MFLKEGTALFREKIWDKFITPWEVLINRYSRDKSGKIRWPTCCCLVVLLLQYMPDYGVLGFLMHIKRNTYARATSSQDYVLVETP